MRRAVAVSLLLAAATGCGGHRTSRPPGHFAIGLVKVRLVAADGSGGRSVEFSPESDGLLKPDLSRDGKTVVYGGPDGVYVASSCGGRARLVRVNLSPGQDLSYSQPALSPDAKRVVLTTNAGAYVASLADGSIELIFPEPDGAAEADWAADAGRIVYETGVGRNGVSGRIVVVDADGGRDRAVGIGESPAISPDGTRVAFNRWSGNGPRVKGGIFVVDVDGGRPRLIVRGLASRPTWSPDGHWIGYMRVVGCGEAICTERLQIVPAGGGKPRNVTPPLLFDTPEYSWGG
ncbi:MAG TPA: hypothetical protein VEL10_04465 [Gaiellaceae bacterium]|nr:hypothetical protein [Gaiellaceae bacterium]